MNCAEVREALPALRDGDEVGAEVRRHVSSCPGCAVELSRYEALVRGLASLERVTAEPPPGLAPALVAIPLRGIHAGERLRAHVTRNRAAYLGGLAVAVAGTAASTVLWRRRRLAAA